MSALGMVDRQCLEKFFSMSLGYVLNFSDRTFGEFVYETVGVEIHSDRYTTGGTSKANKLRTFWKIETDFKVGTLLMALVDYGLTLDPQLLPPDAKMLAGRCKHIASRLLTGAPRLDSLKAQAKVLDANHLTEQIRRLEAAVETDPSLAIGTAKELIETCCKTILAERGKPVTGTPDMPALTKETFKELKLVPDGIPDSARGGNVIKRMLSNLSTVAHGLAELRGLYGTGHGKHGKAAGLKPRHAKLAVGAAATLATFLFETHKETKP